MARQSFFEEIPNRPLPEGEFDRLVVERLGLLEAEAENRIKINYYPVREDGISYVTVVRMFDDNGFWVEWSTDTGGYRDQKIYTRDFVPEDETVDALKRILVDYETPDRDRWVDMTDDIMYASQAFHIVREFPSIEEPTESDEFDYVEALEYLIKNVQEYRTEHINQLADFYGEIGEVELEHKYRKKAQQEAS